MPRGEVLFSPNNFKARDLPKNLMDAELPLEELMVIGKVAS